MLPVSGLGVTMLKNCVMCHKEADVDFLERCEPCFRDYINSDHDTGLSTTKRLWTEGNMKGSISPAHLADIKRRKIGPDGKTYRDYGRRYFHK